jgi:uncharacterized MAPEG superfamily protein
MTVELLAALFIALMIPANAAISGTINAMFAGFGWGLGNRASEPALPAWALRLQRAYMNLLETAPAFLVIVLIAHLMEVSNAATIIGAWVFVFARIVFLFLYTAGVTFLALRTITWFIALGGLVAIACQIANAINWSEITDRLALLSV